jgi:acyl carrier protein
VADIQFEIVRFALALHLGVDSEGVELHHRLDADLGLDPLDLVLVALRLEEIEDAEFPVAQLEMVRTVSDLVDVVRDWASGDRTGTLPPPPPPARTQSGIQPIPAAVIPFGRLAAG